MEKLNQQEMSSILNDFVRLSEKTVCPDCGSSTKMVGETRSNGNWICPFCFALFSYRDHTAIKLEIPFIKLTDQLKLYQQSENKKSLPLSIPNVDFPMNINTGFLVPSYSSGYRIKRKKNNLLAQAIDFTRFGRIKSGLIWQFNLGYNDRTMDEYETLISFADAQGNHLPFNYTDPLRQSTHICYFESDVSDAEPSSFDGVGFSVMISE